MSNELTGFPQYERRITAISKALMCPEKSQEPCADEKFSDRRSAAYTDHPFSFALNGPPKRRRCFCCPPNRQGIETAAICRRHTQDGDLALNTLSDLKLQLGRFDAYDIGFQSDFLES